MIEEFNLELGALTGQKAWGLSRSVGSMFFLEFGAPHQKEVRRGDEHLLMDVGRWRFLFEMCHWKFTKKDALTISSDDDPNIIDQCFDKLALETVAVALVAPRTSSLRITFDSCVTFDTFPYSTGSANDGGQWIFFSPDFSWKLDAGGGLEKQARSR